MKYNNIREEELKNKVGADWFKQFDTTEILGNIDFTVFPKQDSLFGRTPLLWAEAKTGDYDVTVMFVQLVLTIGKARTFDKTLPPAFIGAFDFKKIAFVSYISIQDIFYLNDFNWNVTPSNHETKEFKLIKDRIEATLKANAYVYDYQKDEKELKAFIANNIAKATEASKIKIDKNNFIPIYLRWLEIIKPNIDVNWDDLKKANILDSDFYLADLFVDDKDTTQIEDDSTIRDSLFVVFNNQGYKIAKENIKQMFDATINLKQKETYQQFWKRYKRPPLKQFQDYIIERRDLLVPQDIRERKGAFFTPRIWVDLSQKYLADYLGENWQEEYYVWDCAAGTGNLLAGLTNKYNIWASTLDQADVNVMHERIEHGANLLQSHVFQFDFLNDDFTKLPQGLQDIINDEEKRKKLIVYINPPYAEAGNVKVTELRKNKSEVSNQTIIWNKYKDKFGLSIRELFIQFFIRIYTEIPGSTLASFSKLKHINGDGFKLFRSFFKVKFEKGFVVPADTFDNVKGKFPIGFLIFNLDFQKEIQSIITDVYNEKGQFIGNKTFHTGVNCLSITEWVTSFNLKEKKDVIGYTGNHGPDFQNNNYCTINSISRINSNGSLNNATKYNITINNLQNLCIYFSIRHCIEANWLNDRDQFLYPNDGWKIDKEFQNDCLAFALFNGQNRISANDGTNHWIPFTEAAVNAKEKFDSNFMTDFINGALNTDQTENTLFEADSKMAMYDNKPREFSEEAKEVFNAGRELWKYYHAQKDINVNASFYDIREYFQGRNEKTGRMNNKSTDETYTALITHLREKLIVLAEKIKPKIYEYEFLKQ